MIRNNKNVITAELGATGSGKSYRDLRKAELWYDYHFKEKFPTENICFGVGAVMKLISSGKLRRGDIIVMEEAGVNLGSRDFQNRISKMFNYVLQSFRSMNIGIFFNLPYLSMLDSQARHLLHYYGESVGIDFKNGMNRCKPFFVQTAQSSGKMYRHYPMVKLDNTTIKVKRFGFLIPSQYLIDAYEQKKKEYLMQLTTKISDEIDLKENGRKAPKIPTDLEFMAYKLSKRGDTQQKIADLLGKGQKTICNWIKNVGNYLEALKNKENAIEKGGLVSKSYPSSPNNST